MRTIDNTIRSSRGPILQSTKCMLLVVKAGIVSSSLYAASVVAQSPDNRWRNPERTTSPSIVCSLMPANSTSATGLLASTQDRAPEPPPSNVVALFSQGTAVSTLDFGVCDTTGGEALSVVELRNDRPTELLIRRFEMSRSNGFEIDCPAPQTVPPGGALRIPIRWAPQSTGPAEGKLSIESNQADHAITLRLLGTGRSRAPSARVRALRNNFGGRALKTGQLPHSEIASITSYGNEPLVIRSIEVTEGATRFALLPVQLPVTLNFGESFSFGAVFTPDRYGLERADVRILTNDPSVPEVHATLVGTGTTPSPTKKWGHDYIAIELPKNPSEPVFRTTSNSQGSFTTLLPAGEEYRLVIFDPESGLIGTGRGTTAERGKRTSFTDTLTFAPSTEADRDFDGLPDDVEFAVGTSPVESDTDHNGLDDYGELRLSHEVPR